MKARLNVNEILSTVMLNAIALQLMNFLLRGPMLDPAQVAAGTNIAQSETLPLEVWLVKLVPRTLLHGGAILAVVLAVAVYFLLWRTTIGYRIRAVGLNPAAARYAGIPASFYVALALILGGLFAGLAGAVEVTGVHHRALEGMSGGYGFSGIVAALFGKLHPLGAIPSSILFGGLLVGGLFAALFAGGAFEGLQLMDILIIAALAGFPAVFLLTWLIEIGPKGLMFDLPLWPTEDGAARTRRSDCLLYTSPSPRD